MAHDISDNRRFGRRRALIHALVVNERGGRTTCFVRNISVGGALLEVAEPQLVSQRLTLIVDSDDFEADCEVRHRTAHGIGIYFNEVRIGRNGQDTRYAGPRLTGQTGPVLIGAHLVLQY